MQPSKNNIEAIYSLSPMQEGMLFHSLYSPESEAHFGQSSYTLRGQLNVAAFKQAWQAVVDRHSLLRTLFLWKRRERPLQVVRHEVTLPFVELDWRVYPEPKQLDLLERLLKADRVSGFDFSKAPLMRFVLIRMSEDTYRFIWSRHHIVVDGWSLPLILNEVFTAYHAFIKGESAPAQATRPFRDYIAWLQKQDFNKAEAYWRKTLKGFTTPTPLGGNSTAPETDQTQENYDAHRAWVSEATTASLQAVARQHQLTLNTVIQGAWSLLLSHYSGEEDIVFGTTVSGRPAELEGIEKMVGLFINTLPMRVKLRGDESLVSWLKKLQDQQVEMRQYEYTPLVEIHEWSELPQRQPLFESIFVFESYPDGGNKDADSELKMSDAFHFERSHYPLTLIVAAGKRVLLKLAYDASRFESRTIEWMLKHLEVLLESISNDFNQPLADYSILTDAEKHQSLVEWNNTTTDYPNSQGVHQLFEAQVERTPEAVAVRYGEQQLTYFELNRRANQLAHYLQQRGVGLEARVGIMMEASVEMIVGLIGILKAGGAYVPLDLAYPPQRLQFMLEDADIHVLITHERHLEALQSAPATVVCTDIDRETINKQSDNNLSTLATADNLAYIIYTSGSTGTPKGVSVTHRAINRLVFNTNYIDFNTGDTLGQVSNTSFDAMTFEVWGALLHGGLLAGVSKDVALSPQRFVKYIQEQQITVMFLTAALFNQIAGSNPRAFESLRYLLVGGEALDPKSMRIALANGAPENLQNGYGPTESTTFALYYRMTDIAEDAQTIPIGYPISNTQAYILNRYLQPVPVGVAGTLYLGGDGLARNYWDRPELTAERFVPHPYSNRAGERLYDTGDSAMYLPDGAVVFLGRRDEQIKLRGFRIELGEIEAALAGYEGIREQVVIVREDQPGDRRLVAYLVTAPEHSLNTIELRRYLQQKLPPYMVPAAFVELPALPLNANGKIDRKGLPAPEQGASFDLDSYTAPRNAVEEEVVRIWSEVLMVEPIGIHDNFFELGGHSLLAIQLISKLRQSFQLEITLRTLFTEPTPAQLSVALQTALHCEDSPTAPVTPITPVPRDQSLPLSFAQQRLWFLDQLQPFSSAYNMPLPFRLNGRLNFAALKRSLTRIVKRHESLRTCFPMQRGEAAQVIKEQPEVMIETTDLSHLSPRERAAQAEAMIQHEAKRPFDLAVGPLFRTHVLKLDEDEHVLLITMHHIVADGWSLGVFMKELGYFYPEELSGTGNRRELPELNIQYVDYAAWQRERMKGEELEREMEFWREELKGAPRVLELNVARKLKRVQSNRGATERMSLSPELTKEIKEMSSREGVTLFMFLLSAFYVLLHYYSKREDIVVGVDVANRNHSQTEKLIGLFVNQVVMRADLSGEPTFQDLLARVRRMTMRVYAHQDFPFDKLVDGLKIERELGRNPLFQVMFGLQNLPHWSRELPELTLTPLRVETETTIFDLSLYMSEAGSKFGGWMRYSTDLFTADTVKRLIDAYQKIVERVVAQPAITLQSLNDMLAESDQQVHLNRKSENKQASRRMLATLKPQPITSPLSRELQ